MQQHFKNPCTDDGYSPFYSFKTYEVIEFLSSKYKSSNPSPASRLINNIVYGFNRHRQLPKLIILVPDDDIVKNIKSSEAMMITIGMVSEWITREVLRAVESDKEMLPDKCKCATTPQIMWIAPPTHKYFGTSNNKKREVHTKCLERIAKKHDTVHTLRIIKCWNHDDSNAFIYDSY